VLLERRQSDASPDEEEADEARDDRHGHEEQRQHHPRDVDEEELFQWGADPLGSS